MDTCSTGLVTAARVIVVVTLLATLQNNFGRLGIKYKTLSIHEWPSKSVIPNHVLYCLQITLK